VRALPHALSPDGSGSFHRGPKIPGSSCKPFGRFFQQENQVAANLPYGPNPSRLMKRTKAELLLVVVTFIWGATFVIVKGALADTSPFPFLAARFIVAGVLMMAVVPRGHFPRQALLPSFWLGILLFAGYAFQTWGLVFTTPSKSAFITGFSVILVPIFAMFHGYPPRTANIVGAGLGFHGLYFVVVPSRMDVVNRGDLLTLFGAMAFAAHIVLVGSYARRFSFAHLAPAQIMVVGIVSTLAVSFGPTWTVQWTGRLVFAILVTAFFATAFAFSTQVWAQQYSPAAHTALIFALEPVFAALTSRMVTKEQLGEKVMVGSGLILAGMVISEVWGGGAPAPAEG